MYFVKDLSAQARQSYYKIVRPRVCNKTYKQEEVSE